MRIAGSLSLALLLSAPPSAASGPPAPRPALGPLAVATPAGTAFAYQGRLTVAGAPANASYDFQFTLYDDPDAGAIVSGTSTQTVPGVSVEKGLFTVPVDFGPYAFTGDARWMLIAVRPASTGGYTPLVPRQQVRPTPYAIGLALPYSGDTAAGDNALSINHSGTGALYSAVYARGPVGVTGIGTATDSGWGIFGSHAGGGVIYYGAGAHGTSSTGYGVVGASTSNYGVFGVHTGSGNAAGVQGRTESADANAVAVYGDLASTTPGGFSSGVKGVSKGTTGNGIGVFGKTESGYGVYGEATGTGYAGYFSGKVHIAGNLTKLTGTFKIDHPLDPENKYLSHSFVESPDMKNVYDGLVTLSERGDAVIQMPVWFEALNRDFRYQLTAVGAPAPDLHVADEIRGGAFRVAGGSAGLKVSWQVTGIRKDATAVRNPIVVEEEKPDREKGTYLDPLAFGQPAEKGLMQARARETAATR